MRGSLVRAGGVVALGVLLSSVGQAQEAAGGLPCSDVALGVTTDRAARTLIVGAAFDNRVREWDAGHAHYGDLALARLLRDGSADASFGDRGNVVIDLGDFDELSEVLSVGGHIYAAGTTAPTAGDRRGPADAVVLRLDGTGRLDPSFSSAGIALLDPGGDDSVVGLARGPLGSVYVAGSSVTGDGSSGFIARLNARGELDLGFGQSGTVRVDAGGRAATVLSLASSPRGVRVSGQSTVDGGPTVFVADYDHQGLPQSDFGEQGIAVARVASDVAGDAVGFHGRRGDTAVTVLRTGDAGVEALTTIFDDRGGVRRGGDDAIVAVLPAGASASSGALGWGGSLFLSGAIYTEDFALGDAFLARVGSGGLEPSFAGGLVSEHLVLEYAAYIDLTSTPSGVTVAGWEFSESEEALPLSDALVVRYDHQGSRDATFGDHGVVLVDFHAGDAVCQAAEHIE